MMWIVVRMVQRYPRYLASGGRWVPRAGDGALLFPTEEAARAHASADDRVRSWVGRPVAGMIVVPR